MNFQEMHSTSMLFGTQAFPNTKYNVLFKMLLLRYKIGFSLLCFNASFDHHCFFISKCDIIKYSVAYKVVGIALFSYENLTNLANLPRGPTNPGLPYVIGIWKNVVCFCWLFVWLSKSIV